MADISALVCLSRVDAEIVKISWAAMTIHIQYKIIQWISLKMKGDELSPDILSSPTQRNATV